MKKKTIVYEVMEEFERVEKEITERLIFEFVEDEWVYRSRSAQDHNQHHIEIILEKLKELNSKENEK